MKYTGFLFFTIFAFHSVALNASCGDFFSLSSAKEELERKLGFSTKLEGNEKSLILLDESNELIAEAYFSVKDNLLKIILIDILEKKNYKKGISTFLFAHILNQYPSIQKVEASISGENYKVFSTNFNNGLSCEEALLTTPAAKIRLKFGFRKILEANCDGVPKLVLAK